MGNPTAAHSAPCCSVCAARVQYTEHGARLIDETREAGREARRIRPVDQLIDIARYNDQEPALTRELIDEACSSYFVEL